MNKTIVTIPAHLQHELERLPAGGCIYGTWSPSFQTATVTAIRSLGDVSETTSRHLLAVKAGIGPLPPADGLPFRLSLNGTFTTQSGDPVEIRTYEESEYFNRTPFNNDVMSFLAKERILLVGCGSGGGQLALELAKSGIGTLILADPDLLEVHNVMRHVLGTAYIGQFKTVAMKALIGEHVPACTCISLPEDLFQGDRTRLADVMATYKPSRIIAATDSPGIQRLCQLAAIIYRIPFMSVGCSSNAIEGGIFLWGPEDGNAHQHACYACINPGTPAHTENFDYSTDTPGSYGGEPALGLFVQHINTTAAIIQLEVILKDCPVETKLGMCGMEKYDKLGGRYIRVAGPYLQPAQGFITAPSPWSATWMRVLPDKKCCLCGDDIDQRQVLFPPATRPPQFEALQVDR